MISIPGSKSYTNRALLLAALTPGPVTLEGPLYSDDTEAMIECLRALGLSIETHPDRLIVHNDISCVQEGSYSLFARDSGTTIRFLLPLLCLVPGVKTIQGSPRLNARPMEDLIAALRQLGAAIEQDGPIRITSSTLVGREVYLRGDVSSQFLSALLLITPLHALNIHLTTPLISKPYVEMTREMLRQYPTAKYVIEGDYSSAGYFLAYAALHQKTLILENLNPDSLQADRKLLTILRDMGNIITAEAQRICIEGRGVRPVEIDMEDCPDQVMTLAVLAAFAPGVTRLSGVRSLRVKECERVVALKTELAKMGIRTEDTPDTLTIYGGAPGPALIDTYNDHRIAMAFAIAPQCTICDPGVVHKTFPLFWDILRSLA